MKTRTHRSTGFTLIELMITVVIVAILAAIAIPNYTTYVLKSHRTEAKTAILSLASIEERSLTTSNVNYQYTSLAANLGFGGATDLSNTPMVVGSGYYQVTVQTVAATTGPPPTPPGFTITAVPVPGNRQTQDTACASFTVTSTGSRTATNSGGVDNTAACW